MTALIKSPPKLPAKVYAQATLLHPVSGALTAAAACIGAGLAGLVGGVSAVLALGAVAFVATRFTAVREALEERALKLSREKLLLQRIKMMNENGCESPVRQQHLKEVSAKVNEVEDVDPALAERFELQSLLDHFVAVSINHQKALDALRLTVTNNWYSNSTKKAIRERRSAHCDRLNELASKLSDRLDEIEELVLLVAQRAAYAKVDLEQDNEIERRLNELDEVEAAFSQLSEQAQAG